MTCILERYDELKEKTNYENKSIITFGGVISNLGCGSNLSSPVTTTAPATTTATTGYKVSL